MDNKFILFQNVLINSKYIKTVEKQDFKMATTTEFRIVVTYPADAPEVFRYSTEKLRNIVFSQVELALTN